MKMFIKISYVIRFYKLAIYIEKRQIFAVYFRIIKNKNFNITCKNIFFAFLIAKNSKIENDSPIE